MNSNHYTRQTETYLRNNSLPSRGQIHEFVIRILWFIVSKAFDKSKKTPTAYSWLSMANDILSYKSINAKDVE